jgi:hypothetical protein
MHDKFFNRKALRIIVSAFIFLLSMVPARMLANVIITQASSTIGTCSGFPTPYNTLGNIVIREGARTDFAVGTNLTLVLSAPANYNFNPGVGTVAISGVDISNASITVNATTITITYTITGTTNGNLDQITISGIRLALRQMESPVILHELAAQVELPAIPLEQFTELFRRLILYPQLQHGSPQSRCGTGSVLISATPPAGYLVDWYDSPTEASLLASGSNFFSTPSISSTTTYYAETRSGGCVFVNRTPVVATISTPATVDAGPDVVVCQSASAQTVTLTGATFGGWRIKRHMDQRPGT